MTKTYFIKRNVDNKPKNKLDQQLHEAFRQMAHRIITEDNLMILDILHSLTVAAYKATGGKCEAPKYSRHTHAANYEPMPTVFVHVSETCTYVLYPILGEIKHQTVKPRKNYQSYSPPQWCKPYWRIERQ